MQQPLSDPEISFITVGRVQLAYRQVNPQGAKTLVLLHGLAESSAFFWRPIFANLAQEYRIIAFDLLGHGQSFAPAPDYRPDGQAALIESALASLGVEKAFVIAHSLGGAVGIALALKNAPLVEKLVLYSVPVSRGFPASMIELLREVSVASLLSGFPLMFPYSGSIMELLPEALQKLIFRFTFWQWGIPYDQRKMSDPNFQDEMVALSAQTSGIGLENMVRKTFLLSPMIDRLPQITQPVLFIKGTRDFILSDNMAKRYVEAIPNARLEIISETSHISLLDKPTEFLTLVRTFFNS